MTEYDNDQDLTELDEAGDARLSRLVSQVRELARDLLLAEMGRISRVYLQVPWAPGLEMSLWRTIVEGPDELEDADVVTLERLSEQAGGWWASQVEFVPLPAWRAKYAQPR